MITCYTHQLHLLAARQGQAVRSLAYHHLCCHLRPHLHLVLHPYPESHIHLCPNQPTYYSSPHPHPTTTQKMSNDTHATASDPFNPSPDQTHFDSGPSSHLHDYFNKQAKTYESLAGDVTRSIARKAVGYLGELGDDVSYS